MKLVEDSEGGQIACERRVQDEAVARCRERLVIKEIRHEHYRKCRTGEDGLPGGIGGAGRC